MEVHVLVEDSPDRYEFAPDCHVIRKRRGYTIARTKITTNQEMISKPSGWNHGALVVEEIAFPFEPRTEELLAVDLQRSIDQRNRRGNANKADSPQDVESILYGEEVRRSEAALFDVAHVFLGQ